jgi:tetratricopeptide (TPR) repeat protein
LSGSEGGSKKSLWFSCNKNIPKAETLVYRLCLLIRCSFVAYYLHPLKCEESSMERPMRLCYGSFFRVLVEYKAKGLKTTDATLNGEILSTYIRNYCSADDKNAASTASKLKACASNVPAKDPQCWDDDLSSNHSNSIAHFRDRVIPLLVSFDLIIATLLEIIQNDETIDDSTEVGWGQHQTKQQLVRQKEFFLDDFLAGVYFYVQRVENKSCVRFIDAIDEAFFERIQNKGFQVIVHKTKGRDDNAPSPQVPEPANQLVLPDGKSVLAELQKIHVELRRIGSGKRRGFGMFARARSKGTLFELENPSNILLKVDGLVRSDKPPNYEKALQLITKVQIDNNGYCAEDELKINLYRGLCYQGLLDFSRAAEAYETAALGNEYPWQIEAYEQMAELRLLHLDDTKAAIEGLQKAAALYEKFGLPESQRAVALFHKLATLLWDNGLKTEARVWFSKEMAAQETLLPEDDRRRAEGVCAAGDQYAEEKRHNEAQSLYWSALEILEPLLGSDHPWLASIYHKKLGYAYFNLRRYETDTPIDIIGSIGDIALHEKTALGCFWKALQARERVLGDHWDTAETLLDMGDAFYYYAMQTNALAAEDAHISPENMIALFGSSLDHLDNCREIVLPTKENVHSGASLNLVTVFMFIRACFREAVAHYLKALSMWEKLLGLTHLMVAETHYGLGQVYKYIHETTKAREHLKQAFDIFDQNKGSENKAYESLVHLGGTYHEEGLHDIALKWRLKTYQYGVKYNVVPAGYPLRQQLELSYARTKLSRKKPFDAWLAKQPDVLNDDWFENV